MATIKKRLPYELYDVAGLEDWFAQMAAEGYHLEDCWQNRASFTVGEPQEHVRYRLEAVETYQYDWNKDRAYAEQGWDHVTTILGFFYIFRCDDPVVPELHTDPTIQSWTMRKLIRKQLLMLIWIPLYWLILMRMRVEYVFTLPHMALADFIRLDVMMWMWVMLVVVLVYWFVCQTIQLNGLRRVKRRLASGLPMDRTRRYPRSFWRHGFMSVLAAVFIAGLFWAVWAERKKTNSDFPLEDYPHVTLEEVFPGRTEEPRPWEEINFWTGQTLETSLLVPVQLRFAQAGRMKDDGSIARIGMYYYEAASPALARILLKGQFEEMEQSLDFERSWHENHPEDFAAIVSDSGPVLTAREGWDELWVWEVGREGSDQTSRDYFGRIGNKVFVLYNIVPAAEGALDVMAGKMGGIL